MERWSGWVVCCWSFESRGNTDSSSQLSFSLCSCETHVFSYVWSNCNSSRCDWHALLKRVHRKMQIISSHLHNMWFSSLTSLHYSTSASRPTRFSKAKTMIFSKDGSETASSLCECPSNFMWLKFIEFERTWRILIESSIQRNSITTNPAVTKKSMMQARILFAQEYSYRALYQGNVKGKAERISTLLNTKSHSRVF